MGKLLLLFTAVPLLELYLLMQLSRVMGLGATILLVLVTGGLGAALAKREGLKVVRSWQASLAAGRMPEDGVVGGLLVLIGGVLLITPGVLTDLFGLLLLIPATRRVAVTLVMARVRGAIERGSMHVVYGSGMGARPSSGEPFARGPSASGPFAGGPFVGSPFVGSPFVGNPFVGGRAAPGPGQGGARDGRDDQVVSGPPRGVSGIDRGARVVEATVVGATVVEPSSKEPSSTGDVTEAKVVDTRPGDAPATDRK